MTQIRSYDERYPSLLKVAKALRAYLVEQLAHTEHIDRIQCRAKTPQSFHDKADTLADGVHPIYQAPFSQIQDQIGARVVVYYLEDVRRVAEVLEPLFGVAEHQTLEPEPKSFGYFGEHWVFALPNSMVPSSVDLDIVPDFFELQIKTLFQHAWSEAEHDLRYKAKTTPTDEQNRQFALAAALAWEADQVFARLVKELSKAEAYRNPFLSYYCPNDNHGGLQMHAT